jgi:hypothetical protein
MSNNPEFEVHLLNDEGIAKAKEIAQIFDRALDSLKELCPDGRYLSIVKTKMEEACFFAKKSMASVSVNQRGGE